MKDYVYSKIVLDNNILDYIIITCNPTMFQIYIFDQSIFVYS